MNKTVSGVSKATAVFLMCVAFCFAHLVQAKPVPRAAEFDHSKTGFLLRDVHYTLKCEQCHVEGIFKNTPKVCSGCHTLGTRVASTPKPINHIPTTSECDTCHVSAANFLVSSYKHVGVTGSCGTCHSGQYLGVAGKSGTVGAAGTSTVPHIPTLQPCESCHTNTSTFLNPRMDHTGLTDCNTCHGGPAGYAIPSATYPNVVSYNPVTHVSLAAFGASPPQCNNCHSGYGSFLAAKYNHFGVTSGSCGSCHKGQYPNVVSINATTHIFGIPAAACDTCHTVQNTLSYTTFLGASFDHTTTTAACSTCHSGQYAGVVSINAATHIGGIPSGTCDTCHTASNTQSYTTFLGASFDHAATTAACSTCHSGQYAGVMSINTASHIPYPAATLCDTCHTPVYTHLPNPNPYALSFGGVSFHGSALPPSLPIAATCSSCHSGSYVGQNAIGKGATHIPTSVDCGTCHKASYTTFAGGVFSHAGLPPGTCGTCHKGQYSGVVSINSAIHIPQSSGNACDVCHTNAITGLPSSATPTFLNAKYHPANVGLTTCTTCHNGSYLSENALAKNISHITTTADCVSCHTASNTTNYTSFLGATFSHTPGSYAVFPTGTTANPKCSSCHNGTTALGKVSTHVATTGDCLTCHTTTYTGCPNCSTFYGVPYDHTNAIAGVAAYVTFPTTTASPRCDSCHGSTALGTNAGHIPTNGADCIACHTPAKTGCSNGGLCTTFLGAVYTHAGIAAGSCGTCHQGQYGNVVSINTALHIPQSSGNACDACHTNSITGLPGSATPTFLNVKFHANTLGDSLLTAACTTCHSGSYTSENALAKNTGHIVTTSDCVACHTRTNTAVYTTFLGASFSHTPGTYATFPTVAPASPLCSSCHNGTTAKGKSTGHTATTADCITCHTNSSTGCPNCSTFLGAGAAPHTGATFTGKTCVSCHNGTTATGTAADSLHIPINGIDCGQCHPAYDGIGSTNFTTAASASGMYAGVAKYVMNHTGLTGTCTSCHGGAYSSQGLYGALPKVSNHIPTTITGALDCTTCHTTLTMATIKVVAGAVDWKAEIMNHNGAQGGAPYYCVTCHLSGVTYLGNMQKKSHNGASTSKDCSSSSCHKPLGKKGKTTGATTSWTWN